MKKFLIICSSIFILGLIFIQFTSYMKHSFSDLHVNFTIDNKLIYQIKEEQDKVKQQVPFTVKGVNLSSATAGYFPGEDVVSVNNYLSSLEDIQELGMNTIRLNDLMPANFYNALSQFNKSTDEPLYIIQGISFNEVALKDGQNPMDESLVREFKNHIKFVINAIHGNTLLDESTTQIQFYRQDVAPYVIGYTLGPEWTMRDIIYANIMNEPFAYEGEYFYTTETASVFESFLASLADFTMTYEQKQYNEQKLISLIGSNVERLLYGDTGNIPLKNLQERKVKSFIDINEIKQTDQVLGGLFATYNIYPLEQESINLDEVESTLTNLKNHQNYPIVVGEYRIPSAGPQTVDKQPLSESLQADLLVQTYQALSNTQLAGSCLANFQDRWDVTQWNTVQSVILDHSPMWKNPLTSNQSAGLLEFVPKNRVYLDDSIEEWNEKQLISEANGVKLYAQTDYESMYLMIKLPEDINVRDVQYFIDFDVTPNSGTNVYSDANLAFEKDVDFVASLNTETSRLLVHPYYHTYRFLNSIDDIKIRPDRIDVTKDMDAFEPILVEVFAKSYDPITNQFLDSVANEAGLFIEGNTNPESSNYQSNANYYMGENYIELKVPWALLNFSAPNVKQIHQDYYENFGIKSQMISNMHIGLTLKINNESIRLSSEKFDLDQWVNVKYTTRFKQSYDALKQVLNGEGRN